MAGRPEKHTVDYFSHDAGAGGGRTLTILFNHFGHEGISAWWLLLEILASTTNHIVDLRNTDSLEYLAAKMHFSNARLQEILKEMSRLEAIDSSLYQAGYIWCDNFVKRLGPLYKERKQALPVKPIINRVCGTCGIDISSLRIDAIYCSDKCRQEGHRSDTELSRLSVTEKTISGTDNSISLTDNAISGTDNSISHPDNTQSKESKVKESKEESIEKTPTNNNKHYGELQNVLLSDEEYRKLIERFGAQGATSWIGELSLAKASKGYKTKSDYATILAWQRRDAKQPINRNGISQGNQKGMSGRLPSKYTRPEEL